MPPTSTSYPSSLSTPRPPPGLPRPVGMPAEPEVYLFWHAATGRLAASNDRACLPTSVGGYVSLLTRMGEMLAHWGGGIAHTVYGLGMLSYAQFQEDLARVPAAGSVGTAVQIAAQEGLAALRMARADEEILRRIRAVMMPDAEMLLG